jgi:hypothetical protein
MKKHIRRRMLFEMEIPDHLKQKLDSVVTKVAFNEVNTMKPLKKRVAFIHTDKDWIVKPFKFRNGKQQLFIPEPDPVLIFYNAAYVNYIQIDEYKKKLLSMYDEGAEADFTHVIYNYFTAASSVIIFLYTSIEAFVNRRIPFDHIHTNSFPKKTETYNKKQIEESFTLVDKIEKVLNPHYHKNFKSSFTLKYQTITNLKDFRNQIIHTQTSEGKYTYEELYTRALKYDFKKALDHTADFINYYAEKPDLLIECSCDKNW